MGTHCLARVILMNTTYAFMGKYGKLQSLNASHIIAGEPTHEIMALFVLRKLILQTRMRSHPVGLNV